MKKFKFTSKVAYFTAQSKHFCTANRPKSHILFHKNGSPRDLYIMTLNLTKPAFDQRSDDRIRATEKLITMTSTWGPHKGQVSDIFLLMIFSRLSYFSDETASTLTILGAIPSIHLCKDSYR